jgi:hypothetical protein
MSKDTEIDIRTLKPVTTTESGGDQEVQLPAPPAGKPKTLGRAFGLTARDLLEASLNPVSYVPGAVLDLPFGAYNLAQMGKEFVGAGKPDYVRLPFTSGPQAGTTVANVLGLPKAEDKTERLLSGVTQGGLGLMSPAALASLPGKASGVAQNILREMVGVAPTVSASRAPLTVMKETLTSPRAANVTGGGAAGLTSSYLNEEGVNPYAGMLASMGVGMVPGLATPRINPTGSFSELNRAASELNIRPPTAAMVDPLSRLGLMEGKFMRQVGGGGIGEARGDITEALRQRLVPIASSSESPAAVAGAAITSGIKDVYMPSFRLASKLAWNNFDSFIPSNTPVPINNTQTALYELTQKVPSVPALSKVLANPKVSEIASAIDQAAATNSSLSFDALKQLRSSIGEQLDNPSLVSDIPYSDLKRLYGALSRDMEVVAKAQGKDATRAWREANDITNQGHQKIENFLDPLISKGATPETVFNLAISGGKDGGTRIQKVMESIGPDNRLIVASNFLRKMSLNLNGDDLDALRFAKMYNQLDPAARKALLGADAIGAENSRQLQQIAKLGSSLAEAGRRAPPPTGINNMLGAILYGLGATTGTAIGQMFESPLLGTIAGTAITPVGTGIVSNRIVAPSSVRRAFTENAAPRAGMIPYQAQSASERTKIQE